MTNKPGQAARRESRKPAAVLVKVGPGMSYVDTLRAAQATELDIEQLGTHVTSMTKTLAGDLLVELTRGAKAEAASSVIRDKLADMDRVTSLGQDFEVEIVDLHDLATKEKILTALSKEIHGEEATSTADIKDTGLWPTRDG